MIVVNAYKLYLTDEHQTARRVAFRSPQINKTREFAQPVAVVRRHAELDKALTGYMLNSLCDAVALVTGYDTGRSVLYAVLPQIIGVEL